MIEFWDTLARLLQGGEKVFLALVAEHTRHSPGTTGARLLVSEHHTMMGTIGGGIMEHRLIERAGAILQQADFTPEIQTLSHTAKGDGEKSGMICAGSQTNLYYLCRPGSDADAISAAAHLTERDAPGSLTISRRGLTVDQADYDPHSAPFSLTRDGDSWTYREQLLNMRRIAIIGGGHCSLALSQVMSLLGFVVTVFETRAAVQPLQQNVWATSVQVVPDYRAAGPLISFPQLTPVVIMTTDMPSDVSGLAGALPLPFPFIGVMGSRAKLAAIFERLEGQRLDPAKYPNLRAPVGLPIQSHTPAEIAVSVAAQIIAEELGTPSVPASRPLEAAA